MNQTQNVIEKDETNINRINVYVNDEQKKDVSLLKKVILEKYNITNVSDFFLTKMYEEINCK